MAWHQVGAPEPPGRLCAGTDNDLGICAKLLQSFIVFEPRHSSVSLLIVL
jgi:hypothetical protein